MRRMFLPFIAVAVSCAVFAGIAYACMCAHLTPAEKIERSAAAFVGEFQGTRIGMYAVRRTDGSNEISFVSGEIVATFRVIRAVKGSARSGDTVSVRTSRSTCGILDWIAAPHGESWVVYAAPSRASFPYEGFVIDSVDASDSAVTLGTNICLGTKPARAAIDDVAYLDSLDVCR